MLNRILPLKRVVISVVKRCPVAIQSACAVALVLGMAGLHVQAQQSGAGSSQNQQPASDSRGGGTSATAPASAPPQQESNPFPTDTANVPVMPTADSPGSLPSDVGANDARNIALPSDDSDPVLSPDDPAFANATGQESGTSDSAAGIDQLDELPPDAAKHSKKGEDDQADAAFPHAGPKKNVDVGNYYLSTSNWKGALSRFESAMVEDPENPDVYWGLAEAQRHLGLYADARASYLKVVNYDPDSKHGKDARKLLKEPELANARAASPATGKNP